MSESGKMSLLRMFIFSVVFFLASVPADALSTGNPPDATPYSGGSPFRLAYRGEVHANPFNFTLPPHVLNQSCAEVVVEGCTFRKGLSVFLPRPSSATMPSEDSYESPLNTSRPLTSIRIHVSNSSMEVADGGNAFFIGPEGSQDGQQNGVFPLACSLSLYMSNTTVGATGGTQGTATTHAVWLRSLSLKGATRVLVLDSTVDLEFNGFPLNELSVPAWHHDNSPLAAGSFISVAGSSIVARSASGRAFAWGVENSNATNTTIAFIDTTLRVNGGPISSALSWSNSPLNGTTSFSIQGRSLTFDPMPSMLLCFSFFDQFSVS